MSLLIDTNVISELRKGARCHPAVARWYASVDGADLHLSVLVVGEIRRGIEKARRSDPARAEVFEAWLASVLAGFGTRILPIYRAVADAWGRMAAIRSIPVVDGLMAATALVHDLTLVTRNIADVGDLGARVLDPFAAEPEAPPHESQPHGS
ncbi:VapC toxin family PIN domain ribonuclease [Rhodoplanes elegans]|uniref:Ribonuclease VapC n=1 Tax=Rhodoplanes elegans TaxID=29408 RepID=A0A327KK84_9BRAD|nr:type II toxin-antitoxin system VapC family toxin [Rhodoplanes elegans]MBK5960777.1 VapC toxin family PIN domain ribonuclease [Rhodoplanes elegans]RAI38514.1 VapC toxin family PIN domain ribonuclease [Rhodoplanes elegans]